MGSPTTSTADVDAAVAGIGAGRAVIVPTDTVYGLVADGYREAPARLLYRLKQRPEGIPSALMAADLDMILDAVPELRGRAAVAARAVLPGPFTLVLPNPARRFRWLSGTRPDTIGVRVPVLAAPVAALLERVGVVASTSANLHGEAEARRLEDVAAELREKAAAEIDGGELAGVPSTVIDLTEQEPRILREGAVPGPNALEQVRAALA
jgi:L-threonylcarbamoyladenylate synthase